MQLPCPGFLDHAAQISTGRRHFTRAMLIEYQNQTGCRHLWPKSILCNIPGVLRHPDHWPELPDNPVNIATILQVSAQIMRPGCKFWTSLHNCGQIKRCSTV